MASRRTAGNQSGGVRDTIQLLTSILAACGTGTRVPSETFRQAKFDQAQATPTIWYLLFLCVQLHRILTSAVGPTDDIRDQIRWHKLRKDQLSHKAFVVRRRLHSMGYLRARFYSVNHEHVGARELLLAFGWLLHHGRLFQKLVTYHANATTSIKVPLKTKEKFLLNGIEEEVGWFSSELKRLEIELERCSGSCDSQALNHCLHRLSWLKGKVLLSWRTASTVRSSYQKLVSSLETFTLSPTGSAVHSRCRPVNVHQLFLLRYPDRLVTYTKNLEWHISCLELLTAWRSHAANFWRWMESVLDLERRETATREEERRELDSSNETVADSELPALGELSSRVDRLHREVALLLEKNKPHIDSIYRAWRAKESRDTSSLKEERRKGGALEELPVYFCFSSESPQSKVSASWDVEILNQLDTAFVPMLEPSPTVRIPYLSGLVSREQEVTSLRLKASQQSLLETQSSLSQIEEGNKRLREDIWKELCALQYVLPTSIRVISLGSKKLTPTHP